MEENGVNFMESRSSSNYRNSVMATAILLAAAVVTLLSLLVGFLLHGREVTPNNILAYIVLEIIWTVLLCVMVFYSVWEGRKYRAEASLATMDILQNLSGNYNAVFLLNTDKDSIKELRVKESVKDMLGLSDKARLSFDRLIAAYVENIVVPEGRSEFRKETELDNLKGKLKEKDYYSYIFKGYDHEATFYNQLKIVKVPGKDNLLVIGFADVDDEIRAEEEKKRIMKKALVDAEYANKAKSTFLTNMSHDIRTPLNAIMGFATVAQWHLNEPDEIKEYIDKISVASNQMLYLINNVLDMSMIEGGTMKLSNVPTNIRSIIQDVEVVSRSYAKERNQQLEIIYYVLEHENIMADRVALNRVFMNLLGNASRYTPDGGKISFGIKELSCNTREVTYSFIIEDNGIGMDEEYIPHSVEMFSRERSSTESGIPGVGLGLTITKNIIDSMGGTMEITSVKNEGSKVVVLLTFNLSEEVIEFKEIKDSDKSENGEHSNEAFGESTPRILIAEDNDMNREILENILISCGYEVDQASDGQQAVDMFEKSSNGFYKMILMDIRMPVMDGHAATIKIRSLDREDAKTVPIIAVIANAFSQDVADAKQAGMNDHIAKPVKVSKIKEMLEAYIK